MKMLDCRHTDNHNIIMEEFNDKRCSFFGHRDFKLTKKIERQMEEVINDLVENKKVSTFYFGGFGNFDDYCHKAVSKAKKTSYTKNILLVR